MYICIYGIAKTYRVYHPSYCGVWGNDDDDNDNDDNDDASSYDYGSSSSITVAVLVCLVFRGREMDG